MLLSALLPPLEAGSWTVDLPEGARLDSGCHWSDSDGRHHRDYHCPVITLFLFRIELILV